MCKHDCGVALYPPPEVGGFTATEDKMLAMLIKISIFVNKISNAAVYRSTNQTAEFVSLAFEFPIFDKVAVIAVVGQ